MGIKHSAVKTPESKGLSSEWNADHTIDGDVDFNQFEAEALVLENLPAPPLGPVAGQTYFDTTLERPRTWTGTEWTDAIGIYIRADGGIDFSANQSMGSHKLTNVTDPTDAQDAATKKYVDDVVAIPTGTYYWSCSGQNFIAEDPNTDTFEYDDSNAYINANVVVISLVAPVFLPQGAVVTAVIVYGNAGASDEFWEFYRAPLTTGAGSMMASANVNTEDVTITNPTIDNSTYSYFLNMMSPEQNDRVYGARITYTL